MFVFVIRVPLRGVGWIPDVFHKYSFWNVGRIRPTSVARSCIHPQAPRDLLV